MGKIVGKMFLSSARSVQNITKPGYHRAGPGLYLQVSRKGTKSWLYRYKSLVTEKQREMGLGSYMFVDLVQARQKALENKKIHSFINTEGSTCVAFLHVNRL